MKILELEEEMKRVKARLKITKPSITAQGMEKIIKEFRETKHTKEEAKKISQTVLVLLQHSNEMENDLRHCEEYLDFMKTEDKNKIIKARKEFVETKESLFNFLKLIEKEDGISFAFDEKHKVERGSK